MEDICRLFSLHSGGEFLMIGAWLNQNNEYRYYRSVILPIQSGEVLKCATAPRLLVPSRSYAQAIQRTHQRPSSHRILSSSAHASVGHKYIYAMTVNVNIYAQARASQLIAQMRGLAYTRRWMAR